jgi:hypothetical protein
MADDGIRVRLPRGNEPGIGNIDRWRTGARQIRGFFDNFLDSNPSWEGGLKQLQRANPNWASMAEDFGSWATGTPRRALPGPGGLPASMRRGGTNAAQDQGKRLTAMANAMRQRREVQEQGPVEDEFNPLSIAEAISRAMSMVGGGSVNYDPQRNELRGRASENDARLEAMYKQLQGSYAADVPKIEGIYDEASAGVNESTDAGVANINAAYDKARADQTAQLEALGIGDAAGVIAGAGQDAGAQQAAAVGALETNRGANVSQLTGDRAASSEASRRIGQAAGLEGNLQRAGNQSRLQQLLAEIDMMEQQENASLAQSQQSQAFSLAQSMVDDNWRQRQYADSRADADFDKQFRAQQLVAEQLGQQTAARFDPQQAISATDAYFEQNGIEPTPDEWNKLFANMVRNYSVGY